MAPTFRNSITWEPARWLSHSATSDEQETCCLCGESIAVDTPFEVTEDGRIFDTCDPFWEAF